NRHWIYKFKEYDGGSVLLGDNKPYKILGQGYASIRMHDGCVRTLHDVRYVPILKRNLIFVGALDANGCTFKIDNKMII
uniref:hypothetical protein n=1 Tax=Streptococcus anginosus TaxID=1328 RepID=UPI002ED87FCF